MVADKGERARVQAYYAINCDGIERICIYSIVYILCDEDWFFKIY